MASGLRFRIPALAVMCLAAQCLGQSPATHAGKNVLVLNSYHAGYNWTDELNRGLVSILQSQSYEVEVWEEFLDTRRRPRADQLAAQREFVERKYRDIRLDLIIASDDDATALLASPGKPMFGNTPVVFCGISGMDLVARLPRDRFTGLIEVFQLDVFLDRTLKMFPRTSKVVVVTDNALSNAAHRQMLEELGRRRRELRFEYLDGSRMGFEEILGALRRVPADALVMASAFTHGKDGKYVTPLDSGQKIAAASRAPVVSQNTSQLGQGYLLGNANGGFEHGQVAARMALRVLAGEPTGFIEIEKEGWLASVADYAAMKRFGVSASDLPEGTQIVNRPAGWADLYTEHPRLAWGALGFILLQSGIIVALIFNTRRRRRAELALLSSQAQLERSQEIAQLGSWERDVSTDALTWSDEVYRIFGEDRASFQPNLEAMLERVHPDDRERIRLLSKEADKKKCDRAMEHRVVRPDGTIRHVRTQGQWIRRRDGTCRVSGTVQDVTQMREMEEHVQHALRVDSLGNLAGGIAHDFNNLLTVINGYADLLLRRFAGDDPVRRQLLEIQQAGDRAAALTGKLLAFSRKQVVQLASVQINDAVVAIQAMLRPLLGETIELRLNLSPDLAPTLLERVQLEHAVLNLAANARDAMAGRGVLTISTANEEITSYESSHGIQITPGRYAVLSVSDTGCGMDAATRERIFEPFFTTKPTGKGTGLGLSTVYGMVQRGGGLVQVESEPGKGSTFRLLFPEAPALPVAEAAPVAEVGLAGGTARILLVEDEPQVRNLAAGTLAELGYEVLAAGAALEALALLDDDAVPVHLLITDVRMPDMSGPELAAVLQKRFARLRVLFISGYSGGPLMDNRAGEEAAFLAKPFVPAMLAERVKELLAAPPRSSGI